MVRSGLIEKTSCLLHLLLKLCQIKMLVLRLAGKWLAELGEELKIALALVARFKRGQVFKRLLKMLKREMVRSVWADDCKGKVERNG